MMKWKLMSNVECRMSNIRLSVTALLLALSILLAPTSFVMAQEKGKEQALVIPSPQEFVEKNLKAFNERLRVLRELYQEKYGSLFAATSPTNVEAIAKELPKPKTLRLSIQYPEEKREAEKKINIERGEYFIDRIYGSAVMNQMYNITEGYYFGRTEEGMLMAANEQTSQLLGIPQKANFNLNGSIHWVSSERKSTTGIYGEMCCSSVARDEVCLETSRSDPYTCTKKGYNEYCKEFAQIPHTGFTWEDPRLYGGVLNLSVGQIQGVTIDDKMKGVTFTSPGRKNINFVSPRKFSSDEQYRVYRSCIAKHSYSYYYSSKKGLEKAVIGYKPAGNTSAEFKFIAVAFKKFGFPGYELNASFGKVPDFDLFYNADNASGSYSYYGSSAGRIEPMILLDYGDAGGLKAVMAKDLKAPVTWSTISPGPFTLEDEYVNYRGGMGETRFRVTLGGYESIEHSITANIVDVVLDQSMARNEVSPGKNHKVVVRVKGPADMSRYQVKWTGEGGAWAQTVTPFKKTGETWQAEGIFNVGFDGVFDAAKLRKPVKIKADVVKTADNSKIYTYENTRLITSYPAVDKLELYAGIGSATPTKVSGPLDMFVSFDYQKITLSPKLSLKGGEMYSVNEIAPKSSIEVSSSNPSVVYITNEQERLSTGRELKTRVIVANPGEKIGTAKITARMGGNDIDPAGFFQFTGDAAELKSDPVEITVNQVYLIAEPLSGELTKYRLIVIGPADMTKYQARWSGEAVRTTSFNKDMGGFVSNLESTLKMNRVEILKGGATFAQFGVKIIAKNLNIKLIPPNPPTTVVNKVAVTDLGSLETITECKKQVSKQIELSGFNPGMAVEDYCRAERDKQKQDIKVQREDQKAFNEMISGLNKQGQDIVIVSDTMRVGAVVKGDISAMGGAMFCGWSLQNGGNLQLQSIATPIETVTPNEGGCFNIVRGLKEGFNPETVLKVDLIMLLKQNTPVVSTGERVISYGGILSR